MLFHIVCACFVKGAARSVNTSGESRVFWLSLVVTEVFWVVFVFAALITLSFKWFVSEFFSTVYCRFVMCLVKFSTMDALSSEE